ncbi:MAG: hypothetical protein OEM62_08015 [Acidobacteriota bacterium]|nr:hypothetical protein [Acidobacteriota bacterium]
MTPRAAWLRVARIAPGVAAMVAYEKLGDAERAAVPSATLRRLAKPGRPQGIHHCYPSETEVVRRCS